MDKHDRLIDEMVNGYPLAPLPGGFTRRLMRHIHAEKPVFRLSLLDWLLPAFFGLFGVSSVAALWLTLPVLDPLWLPRLKLHYQLLLARMALLPDWRSVLLPLIALIALLGVTLIASLALAAPLPSRGWVKAVD